MRWLLFLSRLAFICGFCFLLALSIQLFAWTGDGTIASTIIVIGYLIGMLVVPATLVCYLIVILMKKNLATIVPLWLVISNILFLVVLLVYIIIQNAQHNYPS